MEYAVIKTGGKQYLVKKGDIIKLEKIEGPEGKSVTFSGVLLIFSAKKIIIGDPVISGSRVLGKILEQGRDKKITVIKYKAKTRYRRKRGHRQPYTKIRIEKIES